MADGEHSVILEQNSIVKRHIMQYCDEAFDVSICKRQDFDDLFEKINKNASFLWVYNQDICGYVAMYANDYVSEVAYITLLAVKTEYQRKHIGNMLLCACYEVAKEKGMKVIKLEVRKENEKALYFYKRNGFEIESEASENSFYMIRVL